MNQAFMCPPKYFKLKYSINPWMSSSPPVKKALAQKQWLKLKQTIEEFLGLEIINLEPNKNLPDMVFTTDQIINLGEKLVKANFAFSQRKKESKIASQFLRQKG